MRGSERGRRSARRHICADWAGLPLKPSFAFWCGRSPSCAAGLVGASRESSKAAAVCSLPAACCRSPPGCSAMCCILLHVFRMPFASYRAWQHPSETQWQRVEAPPPTSTTTTPMRCRMWAHQLGAACRGALQRLGLQAHGGRQLRGAHNQRLPARRHGAAAAASHRPPGRRGARAEAREALQRLHVVLSAPVLRTSACNAPLTGRWARHKAAAPNGGAPRWVRLSWQPSCLSSGPSGPTPPVLRPQRRSPACAGPGADQASGTKLRQPLGLQLCAPHTFRSALH